MDANAIAQNSGILPSNKCALPIITVPSINDFLRPKKSANRPVGISQIKTVNSKMVPINTSSNAFNCATDT